MLDPSTEEALNAIQATLTRMAGYIAIDHQHEADKALSMLRGAELSLGEEIEELRYYIDKAKE